MGYTDVAGREWQNEPMDSPVDLEGRHCNLLLHQIGSFPPAPETEPCHVLQELQEVVEHLAFDGRQRGEDWVDILDLGLPPPGP
jgi:hypothetical protein